MPDATSGVRSTDSGQRPDNSRTRTGPHDTHEGRQITRTTQEGDALSSARFGGIPDPHGLRRRELRVHEDVALTVLPGKPGHERAEGPLPSGQSFFVCSRGDMIEKV